MTDSSGLSVSVEQLADRAAAESANEAPEPEPAPAAPEPAGPAAPGSAPAAGGSKVKGKGKCPYCHRRYKALHLHIKRCDRGPAPEAPEPAGPAAPEPGPAPQLPPELTVFVSADLVGRSIGGVFQVIAARKGDKWKLDTLEEQALGAAWAEVLRVYLPALVGSQWGVLTLAMVQTAIVIAPRLDYGIRSEVA